MKFLLSTFGSAGDVFPMLGLALELKSRGHEAVLVTNPHFADVARRHGVPFEPLGTEEQFTAALANPDLWHPRRAFGHVVRSFEPALRRQFELHAAGDAVGITNCFGFGALLAQEKHGRPVVTVHLQPAVLWSDHEPPMLAGLFGPRWMKRIEYRIGEKFLIDPMVAGFLDPWRNELGLPRLRKVTRWWHSPFAVVGLFPEWYAPPQPDWPGNFIAADFPLWNDGTGKELPADVAEFLETGEAPVVFTPGTANMHARRFFEAAVDACRRLGRRGILLTRYADQVPTPLPASVRHVPYVALDALLPRAAAFVHHGGIGSTSQALAAGIPQLIMPLAHDQFDNLARLERFGVGTGLGVRRFTGARLARRLKSLLDSPTVAVACRDIASRFTRNGLELAAAAIEEKCL